MMVVLRYLKYIDELLSFKGLLSLFLPFNVADHGIMEEISEGSKKFSYVHTGDLLWRNVMTSVVVLVRIAQQ